MRVVPGGRGVRGAPGGRGMRVVPGGRGMRGAPGGRGMRVVPGGRGVRVAPGGRGMRGVPGGRGMRVVPGGRGMRGVPGGRGMRGAPGGRGMRGVPGGRGVRVAPGGRGIRRPITPSAPPDRPHVCLDQPEKTQRRAHRDLAGSHLRVAALLALHAAKGDLPILVAVAQRVVGEHVEGKLDGVEAGSTHGHGAVVSEGLALRVLEAQARQVLAEALVGGGLGVVWGAHAATCSAVKPDAMAMSAKLCLAIAARKALP